MTTTQVRTFTAPRALGERLADPIGNPTLPATLPVRTNGVNGVNGINGINGVNGTNGPSANGDSKKGAASLTNGTYSRVPQTSCRKMSVKEGVTFAGQDDLPKLPIPELEQTCQKYLTALKPLQSPREHADTRAAVQEFLANEGPELQEKLKLYAQGKTSYIEQFWYDSYLNFDNPVVLNLNPFFLLEDDPTPARNNQVTRASSLVVSALEFVRAVRKEELPPDKVKGTPLCMYQFSRLFGTARVPNEEGCRIEQDPESKHIIVLCHGQFYWFDVLDDNSDLIMTEKDIAVNLQTIIDDAAQTPIQEAAKSALGVLSTENRKVWSGLRDLLTHEEGSNNEECLGIVDSALFVLCLDYTEPATAAALCGNMLCGTSEVERGVQIGTCTNRWYDKLQIIVCKNGSAGINFEHTGVDGHTVLRFASDLYTDTILRFARTINGMAPTLWASTSPDPSKRDPESFGDVSTTPHKLEWDMTPELSIAVRFAETRLADLIEQNEFECLDFSSYGKNFITSMGLSPDAFVQMAFQAAYYGLYGRVECTYEPAMTKKFLHGRTEAIRTVSEEAVDFVQTFWADHPADQKVEALRRACGRHVVTTKECLEAQGCDRHLYALFCVWQKSVDDDMSDMSSNGYSNGYSSPVDGYSEAASSPVGSPGKEYVLNGDAASTAGSSSGVRRGRGDSHSSASKHGTPLPLIFADPGWDKLNMTIISTSNCGNPSLRQFGFGPTSGDGFGIGYIIKDESIAICVSSKHRQTRRFVDTLESYLLEIRRILRITARKTTAGGNAQKSGSKCTRAREIDEENRPKGASRPRPKPRGRMITGTENTQRYSINGAMSPTEESMTLSEDDELGGYGFFDAGMLLQALKARGVPVDEGETKPSERAAVQARRRVDVGKKLRLIDY